MKQQVGQDNIWMSRRGQTLVLVVLIMLAVALLAALFITIIARTQSRTGRQADIAVLNNICEAGIRYADHQLTYSPQGADWRPTPASVTNPYPYQFGEGEFRLTLTYDPDETDLLSRFIRIECVSRLRGNAFLKRTQVAYKPLLLADYVRFVTNKDRSSLPAILGVPEVTQSTSATSYMNIFDGPVRANGDIEWVRSTAAGLYLYLLEGTDAFNYPRMDNTEAVGSFLPAYGLVPQFYLNGAGPINGYASSASGFDIALGQGDGMPRYMDGLHIPDTNDYMRTTQYQPPPLIDAVDPTTGQSRYLMLTRDSGEWLAAGNTRAGIYIDNPDDIQNGHNLAALRNSWMNPAPGANGWDSCGWSYIPPGVEIILHPDDAGTTLGYPVVQMTRYDETWKYSNGDEIPPATYPYTVYLPYPENGTIYAEGNLRVAGVLPPATASAGPSYFDDNGTPSDHTDDERYFDLTIVSGGTIYIEGDIMSPSTYIDVDHGGTISGYAAHSNARNTRLALLARDYVCLNMTAFGLVLDENPANTTATWNGANKYWNIAPTTQVTWTFRSFQPTVSPVLYTRHAGLLGALGAWDDGGAPPSTYYPSLEFVSVGGNLLDWSGGGATTFSFNPANVPASLSQSERVTDAVAAAGQWEVSVRAVPETSLTGGAATVVVGAAVNAAANNNVALAGFQILPAQIDIDALVYAQEGSWFVLPGPWFNDAWNFTGNLLAGDPVDDTIHTTGVASYRMALGSIRLAGVDPRPTITRYGATAENHTASLGDTHEWLSKWSGPEVMFATAFDAGLRSSEYTDTNGASLMRLPRMPCPRGVIYWQQE